MPSGVEPGGGKPVTKLGPKVFVRDLDEETGPVSGGHFSARGATMGKILEDGQGISDGAVAALAVEVHDKSHATGVMFKPGVVETITISNGVEGGRHQRFLPGSFSRSDTVRSSH